MVKRATWLLVGAAGAALGACGNFQNPDIVLDLRVLAIGAGFPTQVVDVDPSDPAPPDPAMLLSELSSSVIEVAVADPGFARKLQYTMTLCRLDDGDRCPDDGRPVSMFASGVWEDPESYVGGVIWPVIKVDGNLIGVLLDALSNDPFHGLGGVEYGVSLAVWGENDDPANAIYAAKTLEVLPRIPVTATGNTNPAIEDVYEQADDAVSATEVPSTRCAEGIAMRVQSGQTINIEPMEPPGIHEVYTVPTIDGKLETFTESISYQWTATDGSFSNDMTGGAPDAFGVTPSLETRWTAPVVSQPELVQMWIVQRDERFGVSWWEPCVQVLP